VSDASVKLDELQHPPPPAGFALPRLAQFIEIVFPRMVGVMLVFAASLKAWDDSGVTRVLEFDAVPSPLIYPTISLVIVAETAIGLLLILKPRMRGILIAAVLLLSIYAAQLVYLAADAAAPNCVCLGAWKAYHAARFDNVMGVGRNVCLILALLWVRAQVATCTSGTSRAST
jgi:hypothetical protein